MVKTNPLDDKVAPMRLRGPFYKTTLKVSGLSGQRPNQLPYGIATINVCDTTLFYRIQSWIEALSEQIFRV